jgi:branched-chain amino acid transport system substrate-binding protein
MRLAAELAEREINARGGVQGRALRLIFADDSGTGPFAVRVARELRNDPRVVAVVGHLTSAATLAALPIYTDGDDPLPLISPSASSPELSGRSPFFFRVCPSDLAHGPRLARFALEGLGARKAAVIYANDAHGRGLRRTFTVEFTRLGGTVVAEDPALATTRSLEPYLSRLRMNGGTDLLLLAVDRPLAELALRQMATLGLRWQAIGGAALTGLDGPRAEGVRVSAAYLPDRPSGRNAAFVEAYARAFGGQAPDDRGAATYDILYLLARVLETTPAERRAIRNSLARIGTVEPGFEGVTGMLAFDEQGDVPAKPVTIGVVRGGRLVSENAP